MARRSSRSAPRPRSATTDSRSTVWPRGVPIPELEQPPDRPTETGAASRIMSPVRRTTDERPHGQRERTHPRGNTARSSSWRSSPASSCSRPAGRRTRPTGTSSPAPTASCPASRSPGVDVGGMTKAEAVEAVREAAAVALQQPIEMRAGDRSLAGHARGARSALQRRRGREPRARVSASRWARSPGSGTGSTTIRSARRWSSTSPATDASTRCSAASLATSRSKPVERRHRLRRRSRCASSAPKPGRALDFVRGPPSVRAALQARRGVRRRTCRC